MKVLAGMLLAVALCGATEQQPNSGTSSDIQRAVAWERQKDEAAARQARKEKRNPSVTYNTRRTEEPPEGTLVKDPGPGSSKDK